MSDQTREENKRSVQKLFESCFNQGDLALLDQLVAPDYVGPRGDKGPAGFRGVVAGLRTAFPDIHYTIDDSSPKATGSPCAGTGRERTRRPSVRSRPPARRSRTRASASSGSRTARSPPPLWTDSMDSWNRWAWCPRTSASARPGARGGAVRPRALIPARPAGAASAQLRQRRRRRTLAGRPAQRRVRDSEFAEVGAGTGQGAAARAATGQRERAIDDGTARGAAPPHDIAPQPRVPHLLARQDPKHLAHLGLGPRQPAHQAHAPPSPRRCIRPDSSRSPAAPAARAASAGGAACSPAAAPRPRPHDRRAASPLRDRPACDQLPRARRDDSG